MWKIKQSPEISCRNNQIMENEETSNVYRKAEIMKTGRLQQFKKDHSGGTLSVSNNMAVSWFLVK